MRILERDRPREKGYSERMLEYLLEQPPERWTPGTEPTEEEPFEMSYKTKVDFDGQYLEVELGHFTYPNEVRVGYSQPEMISAYGLETVGANSDFLPAPTHTVIKNNGRSGSYPLADRLMLKLHIHFTALAEEQDGE